MKNIPRPTKRHKIIVGILILLTTLVFLFYAAWTILGKPPLTAKHDISQYLTKKYNKPFVLESVDWVAAGLGAQSHLLAKAHPADNPNIHFHVIGDFDNQLDDTYLSNY